MMAKKKKKIEEDAWLWMSQPSVSSIVSNPFFDYSFAADVLQIKIPLTWSQNIALQEKVRRDRAEDFGEAWTYYATIGLLDPKLPFEGVGWSLGLGISLRGGMALAGLIGVLVTGTALTVIDPHHKWEGGWDETEDYKVAQRQYAEMKAPWKTQYVPTM